MFQIEMKATGKIELKKKEEVPPEASCNQQTSWVYVPLIKSYNIVIYVYFHQHLQPSPPRWAENTQ